MTWEPDYVTASELKSYLRINDDQDDALVAMWVTTASRAVDTFCHRQFGKAAAEARTYEATYDRHIGTYVAEIDDLQDLTGLAVQLGGTAFTDYTLGPANAVGKGRPYERLRSGRGGTLTITAFWGWAQVPAAVKNATLIQAARFAARRDSPFGVAGSPTEGTELRLLASLDPDLKTALGKKYRREWWAA